MNAIEANGLGRTFGRVDAVQDFTLDVPAGSVFALVGPNGAGKTTTIKLLMNLIRPTRGSARVLGTDSRALGVSEFQRIGYVSENQQLPYWMTPRQLLDYCRPLYPAWDEGLCRKLQEMLDLRSDAPLRTLSRGTRMKAALLASLAYRPHLVVLDEPFTGLDPLVRDQLVQALLETAGDGGWTVLLSSHDIDEVERLADRVGFIDDGRLVFSESVPALLERFRVVEVVAPEGLPAAPPDSAWLDARTAGRTLRFVDTKHDAANVNLAARFPDAEVRVSPMSLREIFVTLARKSAHAGGAR